MPVAFTDTVLNYSGMLYAKTNNDTKLLDAIFTRGRTFGDGVVSTGVRKVNSTEFVLSSPYAIPDGKQPEISEKDSITAVLADPITRGQETNAIQIFQKAVDVSYLKSSAVGNLSGLNLGGKESNVTNEFDFQITGQILATKKDLNYTLINGEYQKATNNAVAGKSRGLINGITTNVVTYDGDTDVSLTLADLINQALTEALENGFSFEDGKMELWINPADLQKVNNAYKGETGFGLPASRTEGGLAITSLLTNFGTLLVNYDVMIPAGTFLILNMGQLAIAELDTKVDGVNMGTWFYEELAKTGASNPGQLYGQAGIDYGAEWYHIAIKPQA